MKKLIVIIIPIFFFLSCNSRDDIVENTYWVRIKNDKTKGLVKFNDNGSYIYYEKLGKKYKYRILGHQFSITDENGDEKKYRIIKLDPQTIMLEDYEAVAANDTIVFRAAKLKDYLLGQWKNKIDDSKLVFDDSKIVRMQMSNDTFDITKSSNYEVKKKEIIIDGNPHTYRFSDEYKKLHIYNNGKLAYDLKRVKE